MHFTITMDTSTKKKHVIIGVCGTTNSGKTSLSEMLKEALPGADLIHLDDYFYQPNDPRVPITDDAFENWDVLEALDILQMMADVNAWIDAHDHSNSSSSVLIIEGFLIFNHKPLADLFDKKFFVTIDKGTCIKRRVLRVYNPPDVPGYFDSVVWPMYLKHLKDLQDQPDVEYIDGAADLETLFMEMKSSLRKSGLGLWKANNH